MSGGYSLGLATVAMPDTKHKPLTPVQLADGFKKLGVKAQQLQADLDDFTLEMPSDWEARRKSAAFVCFCP